MLKFIFAFCLEGIMMSATQVLEMFDLVAAISFYSCLFGAVITGVYLAYDKFGLPLPYIGKKYVPLEHGVAKIYSACQASKNEQHRLFKAVEVVGIKPIVYLAEAMHKDGQIYGKRFPSQRLKSLAGQKGRISEDLKSLTNNGGGVLFSELMVKTKYVRKFIKDLKNDQQPNDKKRDKVLKKIPQTPPILNKPPKFCVKCALVALASLLFVMAISALVAITK